MKTQIKGRNVTVTDALQQYANEKIEHVHKLLLQRKIDADLVPAEQRLIRQALVPTEQAVEIKNGKKVTVERKVFPGYVLVDMVVGEETLHTVGSIQGVIKFVGKDRDPQPLRQDEVNLMSALIAPILYRRVGKMRL